MSTPSIDPLLPVQPEETKPALPWKEIVTTSVAVLALLAFAYFIFHLIGRVQAANELEWTRSIYLLSGVEAIAFAAAGFIFGREVHRAQAEKAEAAAAAAQADANQANARAAAAEAHNSEVQAKAQALVAAIQAKTESRPMLSGVSGVTPAADAAPLAQADLAELASLAEKLFP